MQSVMQTFVARFASKDPELSIGTITSVAPLNSGVLQLRFRMTAKNKQRRKTSNN
jgi:hypothetical protein